MKLEKYLTSLDISKSLKKLGVKQESLACWKPKEVFRATEWMLFDTPPTDKDISAFSVAELGEMLPEQTLIPLATPTAIRWGMKVLCWGNKQSRVERPTAWWMHYITVSPTEYLPVH